MKIEKEILQNEKLTVKSDVFEKLMTIYSLSIEELKNIIKDMEVKYKDINLIDHVKYRIKSPKSIINKMRKKHYDLNYNELIDKVNDIAGIRIICPFIENVYVVRELLMQNSKIQVLDEKDYIQKPKKSGYSSLHLIVEVPVQTDMGKVYVKAEIQVRTMEMDIRAEAGRASHFVHKSIRYEGVEIPVDLTKVNIIGFRVLADEANLNVYDEVGLAKAIDPLNLLR